MPFQKPIKEEAPAGKHGARSKRNFLLKSIVSSCCKSKCITKKQCVSCRRFLGNSNYTPFNGKIADLERDPSPKCNSCLEDCHA